MENFFVLLSSVSFLILGVTVLIFYTPAIFNLREMMDSIDETGELTRTKAPISAYLTNLETLDNWTISIPTSEKYLKYDEVRQTGEKVKKLRKIIYVVSPILLTGFVMSILFGTKWETTTHNPMSSGVPLSGGSLVQNMTRSICNWSKEEPIMICASAANLLKG